MKKSAKEGALLLHRCDVYMYIHVNINKSIYIYIIYVYTHEVMSC